MASVAAVADSFSVVNYVGELYQKSEIMYPFLNLIGFNSSQGRIVNAREFSLRQNYELDAGTQPEISETDSLAAPTVSSYARAQAYNTVQIFQRQVTVSYMKQSTTGSISGISVLENQPVDDELAFQIDANLEQMAKDVEYSMINGAYQAAANAATAAKTRGMIEACSSNAVNAGGADLSKAIIDGLLTEMQTNGARFGRNMVLFASGTQMVKISDAYGKAPMDRVIGGVNIRQIITDFGDIGIVNMRQIPNGTVLVCDLDACAPAYLPVPGKGFLFYEELAKNGAGERGQLYAQIGLDYGAEEFHGVITNLATS